MKDFLKKWFQCSKVLCYVSGVVFISTLVRCLSADLSALYDTAVYVTAISVTGAVFGSTLVWYAKKAQAENVARIKIQHVKEVAKVEFALWKKKVHLQKELGLIGTPLDDTMEEFHVDEEFDDAVSKDSEYLNTQLETSVTDPELENY